MNNTKVLAREQDWLRRKVKEAIFIRKHNLSINWAEGYKLPV